jgi:tRNA U34 5-carboxymethylaminomethyl modifying GTPase MnmE/TrmE
VTGRRGVATSAVAAKPGVEPLRAALRGLLDGPAGASGADPAAGMSARQTALLRAAHAAVAAAGPHAADAATLELAAVHLHDADARLAEWLGVEAGSGARHDELLTRIYSRFCLGK